MSKLKKQVILLLLISIIFQMFTPFFSIIGYAEEKKIKEFSDGQIAIGDRNIEEERITRDYKEKTIQNNEIQETSDLTDKIKLSNVNFSQNGQEISFSANWKISPKDTVVKTGDYFYITIGDEGNVMSYPQQLGIHNGIYGTHEENGMYKFEIPESFNNRQEVQGHFEANGTILNDGTITIGDKSITVQKDTQGQSGNNNIGDGKNDLSKTGTIIEDNGKYYIQWYVLIGDFDKPAYEVKFTDNIGEGLKLDKDSLTVRYVDRRDPNYNSELIKLEPNDESTLNGNIYEISLNDQKISFMIKDSRIDSRETTIELGYRTEILDITKDSYTNDAKLEGKWNDSSTDISIKWSSDGSSSGVMKPNLNAEKISINVKKIWKGIEESPTEGIKVELYNDNNEPVKDSEDKKLELILSNENDWTGKFKNLPKYDDKGKEIDYKVREHAEKNNLIIISDKEFDVKYEGDKEDGFVIENTKKESTENDKTKVKGEFTLKKVDSKDSTVLKGAKFTLTKEDNVIIETTNAEGLIEFKDLTPGTYILKETKAPEEYKLLEEKITIKVTEDGKVKLDEENNEKYIFENNVLAVKNTREKIELVDIEVKKEWKNVDDNEKKKIKVKLYNENEPVKDSEDNDLELTLSKENAWTGKFENLPKHDDEGNEIKYTVKEYIEEGEEAVEVTERDENNTGYTSKVTGNIEEGFTIINTKVKPEDPNKPGEEGPTEPTDPTEPETPEESETEDPETPQKPTPSKPIVPEKPVEEEPEEEVEEEIKYDEVIEESEEEVEEEIKYDEVIEESEEEVEEEIKDDIILEEPKEEIVVEEIKDDIIIEEEKHLPKTGDGLNSRVYGLITLALGSLLLLLGVKSKEDEK